MLQFRTTKEIDMQELKKCPFCGSSAEADNMDDDGGFTGEGVTCQGCDVTISVSASIYDYNGDLLPADARKAARKAARETAINIWNRRVS